MTAMGTSLFPQMKPTSKLPASHRLQHLLNPVEELGGEDPQGQRISLDLFDSMDNHYLLDTCDETDYDFSCLLAIIDNDDDTGLYKSCGTLSDEKAVNGAMTPLSNTMCAVAMQMIVV